ERLSEPGPSTVEKAAQALCRIRSRNSLGADLSVKSIAIPLASLRPRRSSALAWPCSLTLALGSRSRPRHSYKAPATIVRTGLPKVAAAGATSSRIQRATASAIGQRSVRSRGKRDAPSILEHHGIQADNI